MKHTPAPWKSVKPLFNAHIWSRFIVDADNNIIAQLSFANPKQSENEVLASADLIAAAPELLEALKKAESFIETPGDLNKHEIAYLLEDIRISINKAEGIAL